MLCGPDSNLRILPSKWQYIIEMLYETVLGMLLDNVGPRGQQYFYLHPILFLLIANVIGLVPYSFTITSHLIVTFALALATFIGINIILVSTVFTPIVVFTGGLFVSVYSYPY